jgi:hypothetical protein
VTETTPTPTPTSTSTSTPTPTPTSTSTPTSPDPVIIELGERSRSQIRKLRSGTGRTWRDIEGALGSLREAGHVPAEAQVVVVVVRQRPEDGDDCWRW